MQLEFQTVLFVLLLIDFMICFIGQFLITAFKASLFNPLELKATRDIYFFIIYV